MGKYDFSGAIFNGNNIIINNSPFNWKKGNIVINKSISEYHYKCENTGAFMCKEYKEGGGLKRTTYSLPDSEDYNIKSENELIQKLSIKKENYEI